ncbi:hypothetical protein PF010_g27676 [Phytophthora fragariae]|uniref:Reverse transcriptase Ty1/copia-type domain-containing protein n=1 Tax=Phytophthora fragariae TaxID=53985 RepID=A0A6G0JTT7_9STRA|nr:hypothetical protein PF010_g27676 [Phytophthora fragariae]
MKMLPRLTLLLRVVDRRRRSEDNQGAMALTKNVGYQARTKHIDIRYHFIREKVVSNEVELEYVDTKNQLADFMTKGLSSKTLRYLMMRSNVGPKLETSN